MRFVPFFLSFVIPLVMGAGPQVSSPEAVGAEILKIHEADRAAHLRGDAADLASRVAPDMVVVDKGRISHQSPTDTQRRFEEYFQSAKHTAWEDIEAPIIHVSPDCRMVWAIFHVHSSYTHTKDDGTTEIGGFKGAWTSTYEKFGHRWLMTSVTSTSEQQ